MCLQPSSLHWLYMQITKLLSVKPKRMWIISNGLLGNKSTYGSQPRPPHGDNVAWSRTLYSPRCTPRRHRKTMMEGKQVEVRCSLSTGWKKVKIHTSTFFTELQCLVARGLDVWYQKVDAPHMESDSRYHWVLSRGLSLALREIIAEWINVCELPEKVEYISGVMED